MVQFHCAPLPTLDISMRSSLSDLLFLRRRRRRRDARGVEPAELRHAVDATLNLRNNVEMVFNTTNLYF